MGEYNFTGEVHDSAIGDGAVHITYGAQPKRVEDAFRALRDAVAEAGQGTAAIEVENLRQDLEMPKPDRKVIQERIASITALAAAATAMVGTATAVTTAAEHLSRIVGNWL